MRTLLLSATLVVGLLVVGLLAQTIHAQQPAGVNASRFGVAVVDISYIFRYIFKNEPRFKGQMDAMKNDVKAVEDRLRAGRLEIAKLEERLKQFKPGTPEYKKLDEDVSRRKSEFNLSATQQRKDFMEREAKIYHQTYQEVTRAVTYYAQRNNIGLVLRFNGSPTESIQREDVMRALSKPVVYQNGIDITPDVLRLLSQGGKIPPAQERARIPNRGQAPLR